jgi:hypothetical protein
VLLQRRQRVLRLRAIKLRSAQDDTLLQIEKCPPFREGSRRLRVT